MLATIDNVIALFFGIPSPQRLLVGVVGVTSTRVSLGIPGVCVQPPWRVPSAFLIESPASPRRSRPTARNVLGPCHVILILWHSRHRGDAADLAAVWLVAWRSRRPATRPYKDEKNKECRSTWPRTCQLPVEAAWRCHPGDRDGDPDLGTDPDGLRVLRVGTGEDR